MFETNLRNMTNFIFVLLGILTVFCEVVNANRLEITNLRVPSSYTLQDTENPTPINLDCEYDGKDVIDRMFTLKWYHNGAQVSQWTPPIKSTGKSHTSVVGFYKQVVKVEAVERNGVLEYRMLSIIHPSFNHSGLWNCSVSNSQDTVRKSSYLTVVNPESEFDLKYNVKDNGMLGVECFARGIFPLPKLTVSLSDDQFLETKEYNLTRDDGLIDIQVKGEIEKDKMVSPSTITCILDIPEGNYTKHKTSEYFAQPIVTTPRGTIASGGNTSELSRLEATGPSHTNSDNSCSSSTTSFTILFSALSIVLVSWLQNASS